MIQNVNIAPPVSIGQANVNWDALGKMYLSNTMGNPLIVNYRKLVKREAIQIQKDVANTKNGIIFRNHLK